jgi:NhaP-type Na+/H+ or K+/H+ antiporter
VSARCAIIKTQCISIFTLGGLALSWIFGITEVQNQQWYLLTVAVLLAAGLYSSTYGISIKESKTHAWLIVRAVTIGVFLKSLIIGTVLSLVLHSPVGFIFGIIVAQIDPLSTVALMSNNRMSAKAQTILRSWAAFDDPMTVIMSLYAPAIIAAATGVAWQPIRGTMQETGLTGYLLETGINVLFAVGIFVLWKLLKRHSKSSNYVVIALIALGIYGLLAGALAVAVYFFWMLGVALLGLFMRPPIQEMLDRVVYWALGIAAVLLGVLVAGGMSIAKGLVLGVAAYGAQIIVGLLLTRTLQMRDRLHIAFAQQNGITAIILALLFETYYPGTVAIVAPAILVINVLHLVANHLLDMALARDFSKLHIAHQMQRLSAHVSKM